MLTYKQAEKLAQTWVAVITDDKGVLLLEHTLAKPYGWVFFYQSKACIESGNFSDALIGNAPIIVDRIDGEIRMTGTAKPVDVYLAEYEATLPPTRLQLKVQ